LFEFPSVHTYQLLGDIKNETATDVLAERNAFKG